MSQVTVNIRVVEHRVPPQVHPTELVELNLFCSSPDSGQLQILTILPIKFVVLH